MTRVLKKKKKKTTSLDTKERDNDMINVKIHNVDDDYQHHHGDDLDKGNKSNDNGDHIDK